MFVSTYKFVKTGVGGLWPQFTWVFHFPCELHAVCKECKEEFQSSKAKSFVCYLGSFAAVDSSLHASVAPFACAEAVKCLFIQFGIESEHFHFPGSVCTKSTSLLVLVV